jgi:hypothetical protein
MNMKYSQVHDKVVFALTLILIISLCTGRSSDSSGGLGSTDSSGGLGSTDSRGGLSSTDSREGLALEILGEG